MKMIKFKQFVRQHEIRKWMYSWRRKLGSEKAQRTRRRARWSQSFSWRGREGPERAWIEEYSRGDSGGTPEISWNLQRIQPNNIASVSTHEPCLFQLHVSSRDKAGARRTQLLFAKWSSKISRPFWHVMTNVRTLAGEQAVISKTLSEIMVAWGGETVRETEQIIAKAMGRKKKREQPCWSQHSGLLCQKPSL